MKTKWRTIRIGLKQAMWIAELNDGSEKFNEEGKLESWFPIDERSLETRIANMKRNGRDVSGEEEALAELKRRNGTDNLEGIRRR